MDWARPGLVGGLTNLEILYLGGNPFNMTTFDQAVWATRSTGVQVNLLLILSSFR